MKLIKIFFAIGTMMLASNNFAGNLPDRDRDGVPNAQDKCPGNTFEELSRGVNNQGCPLHTDADGVPDYRDRCPNTPRGVKITANGCPVGDNQHVKHRIFNNHSLVNIH